MTSPRETWKARLERQSRDCLDLLTARNEARNFGNDPYENLTMEGRAFGFDPLMQCLCYIGSKLGRVIVLARAKQYEQASRELMDLVNYGHMALDISRQWAKLQRPSVYGEGKGVISEED